MRYAVLPFLPLLFLLWVGCSKPTEAQRLASLRGSAKARVYRLASEKSVKAAVIQYNKSSSVPVSDPLVHSTLGMLWLASGRSAYAFHEADINASCQVPDVQFVSFALKTIALHKLQFPEQSRIHYEQLKQLQASLEGTDPDKIETQHKLALTALVLVGLQQNDPGLARFGADALAAVSQVDYLPPLVGAISEARAGSPLKAASELRELARSERFSAHARALFADVANAVSEAPDKQALADALLDKALANLAKNVLDDIFAKENQAALLEQARQLQDIVSGKSSEATSVPSDQPSGDTR